MTVGSLIDAIICKSNTVVEADTCDKLISGDLNTEITGIVTTFMATVDVIRQAIACGANFIITHEPTYFTGKDRLDWLQDDPVCQQKKALIEENGICIWRFHDHIHAAADGDGIYRGMLRELGWENYLQPVEQKSSTILMNDLCYQIPPITLKDLAVFLKEKLQVQSVRIIGQEDLVCQRVGFLIGGGSLGLGHEEMPMQQMQKQNFDVLICGEITEWTSCAYVRDASQMGMPKGMIVVGHNRTEEAGMKYLDEWLKPLTGEIPIRFIEAGDPFQYV